MCTYALYSVGEHFGVLKKAIDAFYALFARMLNLVMAALPFFSFLAALYTLLADGPWVFLEVFLGRAQNVTNVLGDIVMVAVDDAKDKAKAR